MRVASAPVRLSRDNHVVVGTHGHAGLLPSIEEDTGVDGAAGALIGADGPVLVEGGGALDGRLLHAGALEEVVGTLRGLDGALGGGGVAGVVFTKVLNDVVLDERVTGPAVDGEVLDTTRLATTFILSAAWTSLTALPLLTGVQVPE